MNKCPACGKDSVRASGAGFICESCWLSVTEVYIELISKIPPRECDCGDGDSPEAEHATGCPRGLDLDDLYAMACAYKRMIERLKE